VFFYTSAYILVTSVLLIDNTVSFAVGHMNKTGVLINFAMQCLYSFSFLSLSVSKNIL
jgi:hypothetical protein